jgi:hypothetical protein
MYTCVYCFTSLTFRRHYLGFSMNLAADTLQATSLPSNEMAGAQPGERSDGVGALPGRISEINIAGIPEEGVLASDNGAASKTIATHSDQPPPAASGVASSNVPGTGQPTRESGMGLPAEKKKFPAIKQRMGEPGGVGTLSWAGSETSIALLPEERNSSGAGPKPQSRSNGHAQVSSSC